MSVHETDVVDDEPIEDEETEAETDSSDEEPVTDNVGDPSVEINIEELLQALEAESGVSAQKHSGGARHRLEELMESRRAKRELEDFDDYIV
ncbi:MAG TPA: hypothetical protein VLD39_04660 [Gammaproteobacteria bacterium]|nr:hypothetical protein [Gammaproteobacteria bacterium]